MTIGPSLIFFDRLSHKPRQEPNKYQPSGAGGTRSPPATPAKSKMAASGAQNDPSTPSMRKVDDGEEKKREKKKKEKRK